MWFSHRLAKVQPPVYAYTYGARALCEGVSTSQPCNHSTSLRLRNLHTILSCMLVHQQLWRERDPCRMHSARVHICTVLVHSSTRGEQCSRSLPRRGAPEKPMSHRSKRDGRLRVSENVRNVRKCKKMTENLRKFKKSPKW